MGKKITKMNKIKLHKIRLHSGKAKKLSKQVPHEPNANEKNHCNPLPLQQKRIKYLGKNLPKETKELCTENCKTLMKEIKDDINR